MNDIGPCLIYHFWTYRSVRVGTYSRQCHLTTGPIVVQGDGHPRLFEDYISFFLSLPHPPFLQGFPFLSESNSVLIHFLFHSLLL